MLAMMSLLHVSTILTNLLCLRRPLRVLLAFFWLHAVHCCTTSITSMNTCKRRTSRFVGTTLLQMAMLFEAPYTTYVIVIPALNKRQWHPTGVLLEDKIYVGSTTKSVHSRQDARVRKLRLLQEGQFTNTEVMVHYFHTRSDFFLSIILPLQAFDHKEAVRTAECLLIHQWQPQLNMPWIARLNPTSATRRSVHKLGTTTYAAPGRRLWLRVRRRLRTLGIFRLYRTQCLSPQEGWTLLVALSQDGLRSYHAARILRSAQVNSLHCFALYRMANLLDDPPRTAVRAKLRRCLRFRNLPIPGLAKPLCIPFLAHNAFKRNVRSWILQNTQRYKDFLVPFHLPSKTVVAGKHCSFRSVLYKNIAMAESWTWDTPPTCRCPHWMRKHPHLQTVDGHVASPAHLLSVSARLQQYLRYSADSQTFPKKMNYIHETWKSVKQWCIHYGLFDVTFQMWSDFVEQQRPLHVQESFLALKYKDVLFLRNILDGFFVHGRDHAITHTHVFCPLFAWTVYKATFGDQQVYEMLGLNASQAGVYLEESCRAPFLKKYSWGINLRTSSIPIAYLLLKRKKQYRVARPITSYSFFVYARLFRATSIVLDLLIRDVCSCPLAWLRYPKCWESSRPSCKHCPLITIPKCTIKTL